MHKPTGAAAAQAQRTCVRKEAFCTCIDDMRPASVVARYRETERASWQPAGDYGHFPEFGFGPHTWPRDPPAPYSGGDPGPA